MDCGIHSLSFSYTVVPTRFSNKLVSLLIVDNGYAAACMSIGQWDSFSIFRPDPTKFSDTRSIKQTGTCVYYRQTMANPTNLLFTENGWNVDKSLRNLQYLYTSSSRCPKRIKEVCFYMWAQQLTSTDLSCPDLSGRHLPSRYQVRNLDAVPCCSQLISWPMFFHVFPAVFGFRHPLLKLNSVVAVGLTTSWLLAPGPRLYRSLLVILWRLDVIVILDIVMLCYVIVIQNLLPWLTTRSVRSVRIANWNWQTLVWQSMCAQVWYICSAVQHCLDPKTLRCRFPIHVGAPNHSF